MNPPLNGPPWVLNSLWHWRLTAQRTERRKRKSLLGIEAFEDRTMLTAYVVDTIADSPSAGAGITDGFISLREAIQAANTNAAFGDAPAGTVGQDTISFSAALSGATIALQGALPALEGDQVITGLGWENLIISGNNNSRIFRINSGANVQIDGLTLTQGRTFGNVDHAGAAILNRGDSLQIRNAYIHGNTASGSGGALYVYGGGTVTLLNSIIAENTAAGVGGGIYGDSSTVIIRNSTITNNVSHSGAGIHNQGQFALGTLEVYDSIISNNIANSSSGGGIGNSGVRSTATVHIENSTVSGNRANDFGGGIINSGSGATFTVVNSTISGNSSSYSGGGLYNTAANVSVINCTITANRADFDDSGR